MAKPSAAIIAVPDAMPAAQPANSAQGFSHFRVKADEDRGQRLDDPHAPQQLQIDRIFHRHGDDEEQRPHLHDHGDRSCGHAWLSRAGAAIGREIFAVDVAREEIGARDRHDGGRHERTDGDGRERHADEPRRKHHEKQCGHRIGVAIGRKARGVMRIVLHARRNRHETQKRDKAEHEGIGGKGRRVARRITCLLEAPNTPVIACGYKQ